MRDHLEAKVPGAIPLQFHQADINLHADEIGVLVVSGDTAFFGGHGTINGSGTFGFDVWVAGGDTDLIRVVVWDLESGDVILGFEEPLPIGGGNIVIHHFH